MIGGERNTRGGVSWADSIDARVTRVLDGENNSGTLSTVQL